MALLLATICLPYVKNAAWCQDRDDDPLCPHPECRGSIITGLRAHLLFLLPGERSMGVGVGEIHGAAEWTRSNSSYQWWRSHPHNVFKTYAGDLSVCSSLWITCSWWTRRVANQKELLVDTLRGVLKAKLETVKCLNLYSAWSYCCGRSIQLWWFLNEPQIRRTCWSLIYYI